ncbi:TIGR02234 family membrane protein [Gordonia sp. NPDC003425]
MTTPDPAERAQNPVERAQNPVERAQNPASRWTTRRVKTLAAVLMAAAALFFWTASRLTWARVLAADGLSPARTFDVKGADWSPWLTPLALVMLAAILAAMSLRGWGLRVVAVLIAAAGVLAAVPALSLVMGGTNDLYAARAAGLADRYVVQLVTTVNWAAAVVLAGSVCAVAAGVLLVRVASGAGMSSKYKTPAARREELERQVFAEHERKKLDDDRRAASDDATTDPDAPSDDAPNERMMWDALDTGIDPTDQR